MTVLAFCGPIGSDLKAISEQCFSLLTKECTLLDSSEHTSGALLFAIESAPGDVIVFGPEIFLDEKLRLKCDIKVFLELDADLCLSKHLRLVQANKLNVNEHIEYYLNNIQPLNDEIRVSAQFADLRRPQASSNEALVGLLINAQEKTISELKKNCNEFLPRDVFWNSANHQQKTGSGKSSTVSPGSTQVLFV
ncbi:uridine kinase [Legionella maioricensis]|uniref:Uridine kinase n=1 Tax=Legionella maioricensis TaxID=2896528 RepID=A0A9X2D228_9GAMM|nr:uridine kinase [Legionella maioricensis]MCL9684899.1 uridine kinase [Legionella maioricensis]MCL9688269.1 uridine kinase [Legionella maioricensis]